MSPASAGGSAPSSGFPRLDKYELIEEIGHGGMATVYRARDTRLGREVAVKLIHRHLRENAEVGTRFVAEARAAAKLRHPGIVDVFDVSDEDDPERYLVVELIRGTTLRKILQRHRDMPAEVGASIVIQLCDAVEHAHASSIIHRDIKPENVLVELPQDRVGHEGGARPALTSPIPGHRAAVNDGGVGSARDGGSGPMRGGGSAVVIKITDFGIAKVLDAQGVTSTGQVLGSPAHMAPEQIEGGEVDVRTDVFALGVLMYECLVGHLPFEGKNPAQVLRRVLDGTYPAADRERPSLGGRWARVVAAALAHDPAERTASAGDLRERIQGELEAVGVSDPRAEIAAYFADPAAYGAAFAGRVVPRLTARGEAARKAGDVWGAAADWNRALALAPDDLALLRRMASLTSNAQRRVLVRRAAAILAGSAALGLGAFGVARALKGRDAGAMTGDAGDAGRAAALGPAPLRPVNAVTPSAVAERPAPRAEGVVSASVDATGRPLRVAATPIVVSDGRDRPPPVAVLPAPAAGGVREVQFRIWPKGALLSVDGADRPWWNVTSTLPVGPHLVEVTPKDPRCCKKASATITVQPTQPGEPPQVFPLSMEILPASVSLAVSAPPGAQVQCADVGIKLSRGAPMPVKLRDTDMTVTCLFTAPDRPTVTAPVKLKAGETKVISWPE